MSNKKRKTNNRNKRKQSTPSNWSWILPLIFIGFGCIIFLQSGLVGSWLNQIFSFLFGQWFLILVGSIMAFSAISLFVKEEQDFTFKTTTAYLCLFIAFLLISCIGFKDNGEFDSPFNYIATNFSAMFSQDASSYGGIFGLTIYGFVITLFGQQGLYIVIALLIAIALIMMALSSFWKAVWAKITTIIRLPAQYIELNVESDEDEKEEYIENVSNKRSSRILNNQTSMDIQVDSPSVTYLNPDLNVEPKAVYVNSNEDIVMDNYHPGLTNTDDVDDIESVKDDFDILGSTVTSTSHSLVSNEKSLFIDVDSLAGPSKEISEDTSNDLNHELNHSSMEHINESEPILSNMPSSSTYVSNEKIENASVTTQVGGTSLAAKTNPNSISATIARLASEKRNQETDRIKPPSDGPYKIPPVTLLDNLSAIKKSEANIKAARNKGIKLVEVLQTFGINTQLVATHIGPAVTKFEVRPDANVKVSKISNLSDNIKMELQARQLRIEAPIPGHNAVGVEIPNEESTIVKMKEVIISDNMRKDTSPLAFALGKNLFGDTVCCRLDKMPHLLIAGATGSGKSVCMNAIITSFMLRTHPDDLKLLLIDPKKVEFTPYHEIPHLIGPVINDPNEANNALKAIVKEMDDRYNLFSLVGVRKLDDYNRLAKTNDQLQSLPYIVVIIDELADLMIVAGKEVESSIQRITQLARAAGIHLIVATQRPSTDVITGVIKSNIPSRIAFAVSSSIDSRTILDHGGAEKLLGYGDMLYVPMGEQTPIRVQGVYVSDSEVADICEYAKRQRSPRYADAFIRLEGVDGNDSTACSAIEADPLFMEARQYVIQVQKASTSLLQRRFQIGYNRAARIIEALEENGVIGPANGSKPREVYMSEEQ